MSGSDEGRPRRLDVELVRRGLFASRSQARAAIEAGGVRVDESVASKPGQLVGETARIEAEAAHPWVSRGGVKLAHALDAFTVEVAGKSCLDIGASTGGFTDVLLARGARRVVAVDVGTGQIHPKLKTDPRVIVLEETDARSLTLDAIGERPNLVTCDASFIGLAKVLPRALELAASEAMLVALFKPQFEVGPEWVGKHGIVSNQAAIDQAAQTIEAWLLSARWRVTGWTPSPLAADGNPEQLFCARNY
jgi:23S rRNA (cytidine1920-2'-O)/16S rRNA (cytidine1409-2'-O)-methyltransferase